MRRLPILLPLLLLTGCAAFNRENTPALNFVERKLVPSNTTAKRLTYPLTVPASIVAVTADIFILHPVSVIPDALDDAKNPWRKLDWKEHYFTTCASVIPRAAVTPLIFTGSLLGRSAFDVSSHSRVAERALQAEQEAEQVEQAKTALKEQRLEEALALARKIMQRNQYQQDALEVEAIVLLKRGEISELAGRRAPFQWNDRVEKAYVQAFGAASPEDRMRLMAMVRRGAFYTAMQSEDFRQALINCLLLDSDRVVRSMAMTLLGDHMSRPAVKAAIEKVAAGDDKVLAAQAQSYLPK